MNQLQLVKSDKFGEIECDIYSNNNEMFMTSRQIGDCLGYADPQKSIDNLLSRSPYLKNNEFSVTLKLMGTDGKQYNTRVFTEDGIYEITMLAKTEKAKEFRSWVRKLLKSIRKTGTYNAKPSPNKSLEIKETNARVRLSNQFLKLSKVDTLSNEYKNILVSKAAEALTGFQLIPLPQAQQKMYTASEIGEMFGITAQKVGILSNKNGIKTSEYGEWYRDKSPYSSREVDSFRYNDNAIQVFKQLLSS